MRRLYLIQIVIALASGSVQAGEYIQPTDGHWNLACERDYPGQHATNDCAVEGFRNADKELNRLYKEKLSKMHNEKHIERFRAAQRAWISFRDSVCQYEAGPPEQGGSSWGYTYNGCLQFYTLRRIEDMKTYLQCKTEDCPN